MHYELWMIAAGAAAGLACGFLNTVASSGSAVSLPILMMIGLDPISANATNRLPVLVGALSATGSFTKRKAIDWRMAAKVCLPVTMGGLAGALLAESIPARDLGLMITAAVLIALALLFSKVKQLVAAADTGFVKYGAREVTAFALIGAWLGFIVLDGATYLLLALTLMVGLPLARANAVKSVALVPVTVIAMMVFAQKGHIDWTLGAIFAVGSIAGGVLGARLSLSPHARQWIFRILVIVISAELLHLVVHYAFDTH